MLNSPRRFALTVLLSILGGCSSAKAPLAGNLCQRATDCAPSQVCAMNKCHEGCLGSRDCPEGESCVMVAGVGVCQGPAETACAKDRPCGGSLSCASDMRCRATCTGAGNCAEEQVCTDGVCADPGDLVDGKLPRPPQANPLTPGEQDAGTVPIAPDGGRWPDAATKLYGLTPGTSCFKITSVAPGTTDGCDLGVASLVGQDLPGNYDPTTGTFKLGTAASLGQGIVSSNSAILSRSTTQGHLSIPDCTWDQVDTTTLTVTGENKFTVSVVENQSRFTRACAAPLATCRSAWTWTMELDTNVSASYCQAESVPPPLAVLTVDPPSVDLGLVDVGTSSLPVTITVTNTGTVTSGSLNLFVSGPDLTAIGCSGAQLAPKASCTIRVTARPRAAGPINGSIEVGDGDVSARKVTVSGIAVMTGMFTLAPSPLDLGAVLQGKTVKGTIVLSNPAMAKVTGIVISVSGSGFSASGGTCTDTLASGASCDIVVNFTAGSSSGVAKGSVTVSQGGATKTVAVSAIVQTPAKLEMTPPSATFQTELGTPSKPVTFYVTNAGDVSSAIPTVSIDGPYKGDFSFTSTCTIPLAGGATSPCQVVVVYNPKTPPASQASATLVVGESGGASASATLTGGTLFVGAGSSPITAKTSDLGTVVIGQTGTAVTLTVTNSGAGTAEALALTTSPAQFVLTDDQCTGKDLAPKSSCTALVRFTPATDDAGVVQGQVKLTAANSKYAAIFPFTGTAVPPAKLRIDPSTLDFHTVPAMQESTALTLTIANYGGVPTGNLKVEKTGAQFAIKGDSCRDMPLAATPSTNTCRVIVTFTPTSATSDATGSVVVTDTTGAAGSVSASLLGAGRPAVP